MSLKKVAFRPSDNNVFDIGALCAKSDKDQILISSPADNVVIDAEPVEKKRRGRPRKDSGTEGIVRVDETSERQLNVMESNAPFLNSYKATSAKIQDTIDGIDVLTSQIHQDLQLVRGSKMLKRKYEYICALAGTEASLVGNRISAIKELNNVITNSLKFEMTRAKENGAMDAQDDDKAIMGMYSAYVNTPQGTINLPQGYRPPVTMNTVINSPSMAAIPINSALEPMVNDDPGYGHFVANPTVEMSAIMTEMNPNIKPVVVYNQETHERYFDVIDVTTGQSVPNIARPGEFIADPKDMDIDVKSGMARNIKLNLEYPLVLVGNRKFDEY